MMKIYGKFSQNILVTNNVRKECSNSILPTVNPSVTCSITHMESNFSTCGNTRYVTWTHAMSDMNPYYTYSFAHRQQINIWSLLLLLSMPLISRSKDLKKILMFDLIIKRKLRSFRIWLRKLLYYSILDFYLHFNSS